MATWSSDESKRDLLYRLFDQLRKTDRGKALISHMARELSEQTAFPDLHRWEDSDLKIADAERAVRALRQMLAKQDEEIRTEREKAETRRRAQELREQKRRQEVDREALRQKLEELHTRIGTQQAGYDFQDWFYEVLDYSEIQNRRPYSTGGRQIDGSLTLDGTTYLVETKFTNAQVDATEIDSFHKKVTTKADNTMGVFVSISGYSSVAVQEASGPRTPVLLLDSAHLYLFLTGSMAIAEAINRVRRHASQTGEAYLPPARFGG